MKPVIPAALLCLAFAPVASAASQPLESVDAFEAAITKCLATNPAPATCFETHMKGHFPPGNEAVDELVGQLRGLLLQWLDKDKVFAVHAVRATKLANYAERRVYLIEDTTGSIMMFDTTLVRRVGKWYVLRYNLTSKKDEIKSVLGDVL